MSVWSRIKGLFTRSAAPASAAAPKRSGILSRIFGGRKQTKAPKKDASDFIKKELTDKDIQNMNKFNSFNANNPDMNLNLQEWDIMVTTLGTMGDTIEKFGYEAFKQVISDLHDENIQLSKSDMAYVINESLSIMRNSDKAYSQEDAIDLLRERIWLEYGNL